MTIRTEHSLMLWGLLSLAGCDPQSTDNGPNTATGPEGDPGATPAPVIPRIDWDGNEVFELMFEVQSDDDGTWVDKFVDCGEFGILTGWGGRVAGTGMFTHVSAYCRDVDPATGELGGQYLVAPWGVAEERVIWATPGYVITALGGKVDNENLTRATIRECRWIPSTRSVDLTSCWTKSTDASTATEKFFGPHTYQGLAKDPRSVMQGFGLASRSEALYRIRVTTAQLRAPQ